MIGAALWGIFEGKAELYADSDNRNAFVSLISSLGITASIASDTKNGGVIAVMRPSDAKKIASALDKSDIIVYINSVCGIKSILARNIKRPGLFIGGIVFFALLMLSTLFVFKVEVNGSALLSKEQVRNELADFGIRAGARISEIDRNEVTGRFLIAHPEFSWAAINVKGTTVCLELKERSTASSSGEEKHSLLVADADGVIKYLTVSSGKPLVYSGMSVKKGDLLISGYVSGNGLQYTDTPLLRYDGASGKVYAEIKGKLGAAVPFEETEEYITATEITGKRFSIFGVDIKVGSYKNDDVHVMESERNLTVFGVIELPITVTDCRRIEKQTVIKVRDTDEATSEARKRVYASLNEILRDATLTETEFITEITDGEVRVTLVYGCVKNIAVPKDIGK